MQINRVNSNQNFKCWDFWNESKPSLKKLAKELAYYDVKGQNKKVATAKNYIRELGETELYSFSVNNDPDIIGGSLIKATPIFESGIEKSWQYNNKNLISNLKKAVKFVKKENVRFEQLKNKNLNKVEETDEFKKSSSEIYMDLMGE